MKFSDNVDNHIEKLFENSNNLGIFMQLSYKEIQQLIKIWANTPEHILEEDINLLKSYFSLLAHQNKIEDLFTFFKFMYKYVIITQTVVNYDENTT